MSMLLGCSATNDSLKKKKKKKRLGGGVGGWGWWQKYPVYVIVRRPYRFTMCKTPATN